MRSRPIVMLDMVESADIGGLSSSVKSIINSDLANKYDFKILWYRQSLGKYISIARIMDLKNQISNINPDIVHISGLQLSGFHLAIAARLANARHILMTIHGSSGEALFINRIKRYILSCFIEPLTLLLVDKFYGVSQYVDSWKVLKIFKHKKHQYIYNMPPIASSGAHAALIRHQLKVGPMDTVVVSVGRITMEKGYDVLAQAIKLVVSDPAPVFCIVGEGDYLEVMKSELSEEIRGGKVYFLGKRSDVQDILSGCDIFVLPTLHETLSIALLEASVEGLALIASRVGGIPEIITHGLNGVMVTPGNIPELAMAITRISQSRSLCRGYGDAAKGTVDIKMNRRQSLMMLNKLYQELLTEGRASEF